MLTVYNNFGGRHASFFSFFYPFKQSGQKEKGPYSSRNQFRGTFFFQIFEVRSSLPIVNIFI